ncbi:hypothetical protein ACE1TH_20245 [Shouchella sp. JSM 1781072]|uniref:hypothetical protein n=1 Tax=Bacillaceae TaxID=186817 RepID=UPI000C06F4BF|nr:MULTISPECIES: hypothetical protein [Bacillaceae]UTR06652.1 hypothetical protein MM326_01015 [Alkalihalobacillus sp. LMS6]
MRGILISDKETKELEYILKRELEELLLDLTDERIDQVVKNLMIEKYEIVFNLYKRVSLPSDHKEYAFQLNQVMKKINKI